MAAKYYIYRNLHTNTFSVKYRGKVIDHPTSFLANGATFKVSKAGQNRVKAEKRKNVHACVVVDSYKPIQWENIPDFCEELYYNPYKTKTFIRKSTGKPILSTTKKIVGLHNKILIEKYLQ